MQASDYNTIRKEIKNGDIILYRGKGILAKSIQYFDKAYYNHVGIAFWLGTRLFTIDMWSRGIEIIPLSRRMKMYKQFCVITPKKNNIFIPNVIMEKVLDKVETHQKYDYWLLPRIAIYKKTGIDLRMGKSSRFVCSELAKFYTDALDLRAYSKIKLITPEDFRRHADLTEVEIKFDLAPPAKK